MSGDEFDDVDDSGFFDEPKPDSEKPWGLCVPARAIQLFDADGNLIYDQLPDLELAHRMDKNRPPMLFDTAEHESEDDDVEPMLGDAEKWQLFMGLDRLPTFQEAEDCLHVNAIRRGGFVGNNVVALQRYLKLDEPMTIEAAQAWADANRL